MSSIFKIDLNPTASHHLYSRLPGGATLPLLDYWNSHRIDICVSTLDPTNKVYFYTKARMILLKTLSHTISPANGSLFHSEEKLQSLQWLRKRYMIGPPPSTLSYSSLDSCSSQLPPPLALLWTCQTQSQLRLCSSCSLCTKHSFLGGS